MYMSSSWGVPETTCIFLVRGYFVADRFFGVLSSLV